MSNKYQRYKELGNRYRETQTNLTFTEFIQSQGIKKGRPKKEIIVFGNVRSDQIKLFAKIRKDPVQFLGKVKPDEVKFLSRIKTNKNTKQ